MIQKTFDKLEGVLKKDERLVSDDGKLLKNQAVELANKLDENLINLLAEDNDLKKVFFKRIGEMTVFDKDLFIEFVSNKEFLPDSYTAFKNKIGFETDGGYLKTQKDVVLVWPYKDCVLEGGQTKEDAKRKEIFWNETLAPDDINRLLEAKVLTNWKRYDKDNTKGGHKVTEIKETDNFIIKGNNLLALHSLKKRFAGKVKLIYIDPPYNTGNDSFGYNDSFNHSTWLTFMKNRLEVARELLKNDGTIFINIDDKEYSYLKVLCDEIFDKGNFLNTFTIKTSDPSGHKTVNPSPYSQAEYILLYAKDKSQYKYEIAYVASEYDSGYNHLILNIDSNYEKWKIVSLFDYFAKENGYKDTRDANTKLGKHVFLSMVAEYALKNKERIFQTTAIADDAAKDIIKVRDASAKRLGVIYRVQRGNDEIFIKDGRQMYFYSSKVRKIDSVQTPAKPLTNLWTDIPYNGISNEGNVKLKNGKKPEKLLRRIIEIGTEKNDIVLDFFAGSGTSLAVAHKLGRQYIGIEQLEYIHDLPEARLKEVIRGEQTGISKAVNWKGGGSFVFTELLPLNEKFVREVENVKNKKEMSDLWKKIEKSGFFSYRVDEQKFHKNAKVFSDLSLEEQKQFTLESLNKNMLYVPINDIDDSSYKVSKEDIKLNEEFYSNRY